MPVVPSTARTPLVHTTAPTSAAPKAGGALHARAHHGAHARCAQSGRRPGPCMHVLTTASSHPQASALKPAVPKASGGGGAGARHGAGGGAPTGYLGLPAGHPAVQHHQMLELANAGAEREAGEAGEREGPLGLAGLACARVWAVPAVASGRLGRVHDFLTRLHVRTREVSVFGCERGRLVYVSRVRTPRVNLCLQKMAPPVRNGTVPIRVPRSSHSNVSQAENVYTTSSSRVGRSRRI
jgi:hypothetical protein